MKIKKVFKYGTGHEIPEGAVYLSTQVEKMTESLVTDTGKKHFEHNRLVWHYFLVEVEE